MHQQGAEESLRSRRLLTGDLCHCALVTVCAVVSLLPSGCLADLTCEALLMLSGNFSLQSLASSWNQSLSNATGQWSGSGLYCDTSIDGIGTCWPRSGAGQMVSRPCPEMFYGVRYNTTNNVYRKCLANGTWALKGNYSMCKAILHEEMQSESGLTLMAHTFATTRGECWVGLMVSSCRPSSLPPLRLISQLCYPS
ncbi:Corticotropin-releasing factor receptor 1 [Collichthys lucidus]|uniref:Corticotropin-releasing factor receptor 1 n=1 Tax=Collichthys lucidus TaxID=240159 RepID=A0A4V6ASS4_COLLU|nr:Corticotropin-releasing factor receptor 1 [Collichthys lucidus]